jgi:hypothetical protein
MARSRIKSVSNRKVVGSFSIGPNVNEDELVKHPTHYNSHPSGIEAIKVIQHFSFNVGTAVKHLWRAGLKGETKEDKLRDLRKAREYIDFEISKVEEYE